MRLNKYFKLTVLALTLSYTFSAYAKDKSHKMMNHPMASEPHFIEMMRMHHEGGIDMAKVAMDRSQNPEIKKVSQKIIDAQTTEIAQLVKWKKQWHSNVDTKMDMSKMDMPMMDLSQLKSKSGHEFDSEYLKMMAMHHKGAIKMAKEAAPNLQHKEVAALAEKIIQDQTLEVAHLNQIQKSL